MHQTSQFKPAWWLTNPHMQTLGAKLFRRNPIVTFPENIELPDGDFIELAWTEVPTSNNSKPITVVLHGLEGSKDSHYANRMLAAIKSKDWIGVLMHFRGCGEMTNRKANSYHSGDTRDLSYLTKLLHSSYSQTEFSILGFSLGGNVLTKYLAQEPNNPYKAATVICAPLDLASCSARINKGFSKLYQKYLLDMLKASTLVKVKAKLIRDITKEQIKAIKNIKEFDNNITAPLNGFDNAEDYYEKSSGKQVLNQIKQPCLFIHAADDPFLCHQSTLPTKILPSNITFEVSNGGGHVGFIYGKNPFRPKFWLEHRTLNYLAQFIITQRNATA